MADYKQAGVDVDLGDKCSALAYDAAKSTFPARKGMIGEPVIDDGGFSGALDMGDYYLVQNDDGIGSKMAIAEKIGKFETMGYDLVAMVADDAVCVGAETISITETLDVNVLDENKVKALMIGLKAACLEQKIVVPGGEIAELGDMLNGYIWNATALGIVEKHKLITGKDIQPDDKLIGLYSPGLRSNGFSLVRYILKEKFGPDWHFQKYDDTQTWGEAVLIPSKIYSAAILEMYGRFKAEAKIQIKGIAHITGGGIPGNLPRILKKTGLGAEINLPKPDELVQKLIELGSVKQEEAYETWNMNIGMILVANDFDQVAEICQKHDVKAQIVGKVTENPGVIIQ